MKFKLFCLSTILCTASAFGSTVTVGGLDTSEGNFSSGFTLPVNINALRIQTLLTPSVLPGLAAGTQITGIAFRLEGGSESLSDTSTARFQVGLGTTLLDAASMSSTFAANRGIDFTTVYDAALTLTLPGGATPNAFGAEIAFSTPFLYTGGNLLIEVAQTGFSFERAQDWLQSSDLFSRFNGGFNSTEAGPGLLGSPVYQFTVATPVPEPAATSALVAAAGFGFALVSRRRRTM